MQLSHKIKEVIYHVKGTPNFLLPSSWSITNKYLIKKRRLTTGRSKAEAQPGCVKVLCDTRRLTEVPDRMPLEFSLGWFNSQISLSRTMAPLADMQDYFKWVQK